MSVIALVLIGSAFAAEMPSVYFPELGGGNKSLTVEAGVDFVVKLTDYRSTGYNWYQSSISPESLATVVSNVTGGGDTEPPYLNVTYKSGTGEGQIKLLHVKEWEKDDPQADRSYATVHLTVQSSGDIVV
eukprot:gnl/MRDRNA2_/MRDRNA2_145796_c0_seq1.p1 gnl/MRDRNA2_/MRDRNA2_145796_c0~~gnl/MRDRNA2_/MRDRNA2_145796_c0_seq1.p1  ORF type:complete len:130 (+),score=19.16 gnl/MRDRNA2_/MRDRNA2_145796_c0_seq1:71-460(+)